MATVSKWGAGILLFAIVAVVVVIGPALMSPKNAASSPNMFYGLIQDQDGKALADVEVEVRTAEVADIFGNYIPDARTAKQTNVLSDVNGRFTIALPAQHNCVDILTIKKQGYEWVWELDTGGGNYPYTQYRFKGKRGGEDYESAPDNPAIFCLYQTGSASKPQGHSRGGASNHDGRRVKNEFVSFEVPSAGPNAPKSRDEINKALLANHERKARR